MNPLRRISPRKTPPGLERVILRRMPALFLWTLLLPVAASILIRVLPFEGTTGALNKRVSDVDIVVIASVITLWTALLTVALGCVLVSLMKGPGYVADAYDAETPEDEARDETRNTGPSSTDD